jgi:signal transduction histidine kinase
MKLSLRSRIYLGILPLLLLFLGILFYLITDIRGLYRDTREISFANLDVGRNLSEIQEVLTAMEVLLGEGDGYRARDRDKVSLNRLSKRISQSTEGIQISTLREKLSELMFEIGSYDSNLRKISELSIQLSEGNGDPAELYGIVKETNQWTSQLRESLRELLQNTQDKIEARIEVLYAVVIGGMFVAIALTLAISTVLWRRIILPIEEMSRGLENFDGESEALNIEYNHDDELGSLARNLESMTSRLKDFQQLTNVKLIRSTSALRSILEQSPDAFFIFSEKLEPVYFSKSARHLQQDLNLTDKIPQKIRAQMKRTLDLEEAQLSREIKDAVRITLNGEEKWFLVHTFPFDAPDASDFSYKSVTVVQSIAVIFQEVTLLKLSDSLRKNLIATVSHELKTPITSARMSLYLLLDQQLGELNKDQLELVETARDDVNRQLATIENLLDLSRLEEGIDDLELSEFIACDLVKESIQAHQEISTAQDVRLLYTPPASQITLRADKDKLRIVLNNLIMNAIKYSGEGGLVEVCVSATNEHCRIEVVDQGIGMDEGTIRKIFDAYTRGSESEAVKGTGLGLKIAKDIIEKHGGQIGCMSKIDEGSTFFIDLPFIDS